MHSDHADPPPGHDSAVGEKNRVAFLSVVAALLLTGAKVAVGLWTGSLGILAEALHSGLDLAAAVVTLWAVRLSGRPADKEHAYGHGKIENLSALFETALLLVTCIWIIKEGIERLFFEVEVHVDANLWSFLVVILSIAVDYSRSRALLRVARKYDSQALEADALHFSTDIWSSLVVLLGLGGVLAAHALGIPWLAKADAVAALGVAGVVVLVSLKLGRKSIADLLDTVPADLTTHIAKLARVEGVKDVKQVRVRRSGPELFVDLSLVVGGAETLGRGHEIACAAEVAIKRELPRADIVAHVEPAEYTGEDLLASVRLIAAAQGASAHNLMVFEETGQLVIELHLEMDPDMPLSQAHDRLGSIEHELRRIHPRVARIITHVEPSGARRSTSNANPQEAARVQAVLLSLPELAERSITPEDIEVRGYGAGLSLSFRCGLPAATSIKDAHEIADLIEGSLRSRISNLSRVLIRTEPKD